MGLLSKEAIFKGLWDVVLLGVSGTVCVAGSRLAFEKALAGGAAPAAAHTATTAGAVAGHAAPAAHGAAPDAHANAGKPPEGGTIYPMKATIVNLAGDSTHRFAKVSLTLEVVDAGVVDKLKELDHQVNDALIEIMGSIRAQDVTEEKGKSDLKERLKSRVNRLLPSSGVREVYLTEFLVQ